MTIRYTNDEPFLDNVKDSTIKEIPKYRNYPSIAVIRNNLKKQVEHLILNQDVNKVIQISDIPVKVVKENIDVFSDFLCVSSSRSIKS